MGKHIFWICLIITAVIAGAVQFLAQPAPTRQAVTQPQPQLQPTPPRPAPAAPQPVLDTATPAPSSDQVYKWVDDKGATHFSDRPVSNAAEAVTLKPLNVVSIPANEKDRIDVRHRQEVTDYLAGNQPFARVVSSPAPLKPNYVVERASAEQKPKHVELSGRISGGPKCGKLRLSIEARSDRGGFVVAHADVTDAGGDFGSLLFEAKPKHGWDGNYPKPAWEISRIDFTCRD